MKLIDKLKTAWLTHEEINELEQYVKKLEIDANRYRWLNKYTSQLLMVTEKQMNEQIDNAMGKNNGL
jgi:spore cortex formation protein SpoVR/YcgB (stage V sporulation)